MPDLTTELRQMAGEAQRVRPQDLADIIREGDRVRRRTFARRSAAGLSAAAAVAGVALAVTATQPGAREAGQPTALGASQPGARQTGQQTGQQPAQLTDWTVTRQADGDVSVTIRQFADLAGLQQTLRADGVPASVLPAGQANPCQAYSGTTSIQQVVTGLTASLAAGSASPLLIIHPSALPSGAGLQLVASSGFGHPGASGDASFQLVQASAACTGS
jgi:hypothetical protein